MENKATLRVELLSSTKDLDIIAYAGKLCYSKTTISDLKKKLVQSEIDLFVEKLTELGHLSPLEHVSFTFGIEGISRAATHQLVRHRIASYSQQSQRYVKQDQFNYVIPSDILKNEKALEIFLTQMKQIQKSYKEITTNLMDAYIYDYLTKTLNTKDIINESKYLHKTLKEMDKRKYNELEKVAIENARYVFPNACETKIIVTMNARALLNFFNERCCVRAQKEIREVAYKMLMLVKKEAPAIFKKAGPKCFGLGYCPENDMKDSECHKITHKQLLDLIKTNV